MSSNFADSLFRFIANFRGVDLTDPTPFLSVSKTLGFDQLLTSAVFDSTLSFQRTVAAISVDR